VLGTSVGLRDTGIKEANLLSRDLTAAEIEEEAAKGEARRTERFRDHFEHIAIVALYALAALFGVLVFTWFFHLLAPENWQYLTDIQIGRLQNIVTGGVIGAVLTHIKRRVG
jgi:hypothetical protein